MRAKPTVPDMNPADAVQTRMQAKAGIMAPLEQARKAPTKETDLDTRLSIVEDLLTGVLTALNGATITAVCNGDGTITVTLTLPNLPG